MITYLDLQRAIFKTWDDAGLDAEFKEFWAEAQKNSHLVMLDDEASPNQPFPYCVVEFGNPSLVGRSTSACNKSDETREYRETPFTFNVHAKNRGSVPAKIAAGEMAEKIMAVFGGHPTIKPQKMSLTHGNVLLCQYLSEYSTKTGDQEWQWVINYSLGTDLPVKG